MTTANEQTNEVEVAATAAPKAPKAKKPAKVAKPKAKPAKKVKAKKAAKSKARTDGKLVPANIEAYVKAKSAAGNTSLHNGDSIAKQLAGKDLDAIYGMTARAALKAEHKRIGGASTIDGAEKALRAAYKSLNPGMQRMNLGNILRGCQQ
jgi:hypothetical protein